MPHEHGLLQSPAGTQTTLYIAGLYEQVTKPSGVIEHKHYIVAGGEAVAIRTLRSNSADDTRYMHKDHLGSVDVITSETGSVVQRLSYDAFGQRRNATAWSGALLTSDWTSIAAITPRGFTFHEELDNVDLIHMNGRVYDANIGRFISADPFIQAPLMSQSFNRYSYVINNPLSLVDPSGYSWFSKTFKKITRHVNAVVRFHFMPTPRNFFETIKSIPGQDKIDRYVMTHEWAYKVGYAAAVVSSWPIGGYGGAVYQAYYTYVATGSATEAVKVGMSTAAIQFATNYRLTGSGFRMPAPTSSGPIILYADSGAGAAGGASLFDMFMSAYYDAPSAPDYSAVGGASTFPTAMVGIGPQTIRDLTERIARGVGDVSEVASNKTKWAKTGELGEQLARDYLLASGYTILASQLYVRTSAGLRITDFVVTGGKLGTDIAGFEVKVNGADRSSLQVFKDNLISTQGGTIASWRQPNFTRGLPIQYTTYLMYVDLEVR